MGTLPDQTDPRIGSLAAAFCSNLHRKQAIPSRCLNSGSGSPLRVQRLSAESVHDQPNSLVRQMEALLVLGPPASRLGSQSPECPSMPAIWLSASSIMDAIGTSKNHFAESIRLAQNSQHSHQQASESQIMATRVLQDAAVVANCNTHNRNRPIRELRKGSFFRGRYRGAGIDSRSESFRTAFHTIDDLNWSDEATELPPELQRDLG